jgi:Glycosyl hydrolase family 71
MFFVIIFSLSGCASRQRELSRTLHSNVQNPENSPVLLAAYQPWFGRRGHIDVGYSTQDTDTLAKQIIHARELNISGFVVNWYGPSRDFEDRSYALLQRVASENDFKTALMYDESVDDPNRATDQAISDLQYAYDRYIGPHATLPRNAYLTYNNRPLILIYPKNGATEWGKVRDAVSNWEQPPLLIYVFSEPDRELYQKFDGLFAWVSPGKRGWAKDGGNWGRDYLESFYRTMTRDYPDKLAVGAAWPGFDDSKAEWGRGRKMNARCGKTLEDSLRMYKHFYPGENSLPFLMIVTWNDYEEGTAIERGFGDCSSGRTNPDLRAAGR